MKKFFVLFVVAILIFAGCETDKAADGDLTVIIENKAQTRGIENVDMVTKTYVIDIFNSVTKEHKELTTTVDHSSVKTSVPVGDTIVTVTAFNKNGEAIGSGKSESFSVVPGRNNICNIRISDLVGNGTFAISLKGPMGELELTALIWSGNADPEMDEPSNRIVMSYKDGHHVGNINLRSGFWQVKIVDKTGNTIISPQSFRVVEKITTRYTADINNSWNVDIKIENAITPSPSITLEMKNEYTIEEAYTITSIVNGLTEPVTYSWYFDNNLIKGATGSVLTGKMPKINEVDTSVPHSITCRAADSEKSWTATADFNIVNVPGYDMLKDTVLTGWIVNSDTTSFDRVIANFNETNPYGIRVVANNQYGYGEINDKLLTALANNEKTPDIAMGFNNVILDYSPAEKLLDMTPYFADSYGISAEELSTTIPAVRKSNQFSGGEYSVSFCKSPLVLFYDKAFFDANNIVVPKTLDELSTVATQCTTVTHKPSLGFDGLDSMLIQTFTGMGVPAFNDAGEPTMFRDEQVARKIYYWFYNGFKNGSFMLPNDQDKYCSEAFGRGEIKMYVGYSSGYKHAEMHSSTVAVAALPVDRVPACEVLGGNFFGLKSLDQNRNLAISIFLEYLASAEAQAIFSAQSGYLPMNIAAMDEQVYKDSMASSGLSADIKNIWATIDKTGIIKETPTIATYGRRKLLEMSIQELAFTDHPVEVVLASTAARINENPPRI